jgi:hypothetical protein
MFTLDMLTNHQPASVLYLIHSFHTHSCHNLCHKIQQQITIMFCDNSVFASLSASGAQKVNCYQMSEFLVVFYKKK